MTHLIKRIKAKCFSKEDVEVWGAIADFQAGDVFHFPVKNVKFVITQTNIKQRKIRIRPYTWWWIKLAAINKFLNRFFN